MEDRGAFSLRDRMLPDEDQDDERADRQQDGSRHGEAKDESRWALSPRRIRARAPQTLPEGRTVTSGGGGRQRRSLAALRGRTAEPIVRCLSPHESPV